MAVGNSSKMESFSKINVIFIIYTPNGRRKLHSHLCSRQKCKLCWTVQLEVQKVGIVNTYTILKGSHSSNFGYIYIISRHGNNNIFRLWKN